MIRELEVSVRSRGEQLRHQLRRRKLVFLHLGAAFECMRGPLAEQLGGEWITVGTQPELDLQTGQSATVFLDGIERFAPDGTAGGQTLGWLRVKVDEAIDSGKNVCLVSRSPANAYAPVPGSSLIEDASAMGLALLDKDEVQDVDDASHWAIPELHSREISAVLLDISRELGVDLLVALDGALFEAPLSPDYLNLLAPREVSGLVSAGLLAKRDGSLTNPLDRRMTEFATAVASAIAELTSVQPALASVSNSLWTIERTLRRAVRSEAVTVLGPRWRTQILNGDIAAKVLDRARIDSYPLATSVASLRDPIEWTTLGELLEIFKREPFSSAGLDSIGWKKFAEEVLPIRNRISHMRLVKNGDASTAHKWSELIRKRYPI